MLEFDAAVRKRPGMYFGVGLDDPRLPAMLLSAAARHGLHPATRVAEEHSLSTVIEILALGDFGWIQTANFIVAGLLTLAFVVGLRSALRPLGGATLVPVLIGAISLGLLGAGLFATDPVSGYPPETPDAILQYSTHGTLHDLFSMPTFLAWPIACIVSAVHFLRGRKSGWAIYSAATGLIFAGAFVLSSMGFAQVEALVDLGGLFQRIAVTVGFAWITLLAIHLLTTSHKTPV
ncbi:DUF998 domain-containing protein [Streptosporangium canum]|uniref:DUF998 domain-containing protein n=1 Tax=Streptosporangium canum TaxID=324952 RepID=UPI0033B45F27